MMETEACNEEKYYIVLYKYAREEIYTYCNKSRFNIKDAIFHRDKWNEENSPYESVICCEVDTISTLRDYKLSNIID